MKSITLSFFTLLSASLPAVSQVSLNQGDSFTFEFTTIPFAGVIPGYPPPANFIQFELEGFSRFEQDKIQWELFENSTAEAPFGVYTLPPGLVEYPRSELSYHWGDLQGALRLTMLSGSATVTGIIIDINSVNIINGGADFDNHKLWEMHVVPVPEPSVIGLFGAVVIGAGLYRVYRGRRDNAS